MKERWHHDHPMWWVASYPKSGNTWMRLLCGHYCRRANISQNLCAYDDLNPYFYQTVSPWPEPELDAQKMIQLRPAVMAHMQASQFQPRMVKTHFMNCGVFGFPLFHPFWTTAVVYILRDPRDVCCSFADHLGQSHAETAELMTEQQAAIQKEGMALAHMIGSWSGNITSWAEVEDSPFPIHVVRYEDLKADTEGEFADVLQFLGIEANPELVSEVVEMCSFEELRDAEDGMEDWDERSSHQDQFFRRGESGAWRDELSPGVAGKLYEDHGPVIERWYPETSDTELEVVG